MGKPTKKSKQNKERDDLRINVSFKSLDEEETDLYDWIKKKSKMMGPSCFIKMHMMELKNSEEK